ncbi:hypothetical protein MY04_2634 [Flammeovirga sp. MY04]|uniref:type IX secretion system periplasmic lipoprotein PorW/SprE n=1 Tax=Flammeovirga sp. MY04 TaxID=1191459 RepID=UPI0008250F24|nr:hypothetical protein [Flammeovirga sp. MY04]ANQ50003.2 hypothetical protein MY04_2634 [Flammeovirga sp. MY04]
MKHTFSHKKYFLAFKVILFLILGTTTSCHFYHNTATHYNSYFLAREGMDRFHKQLFETHQDDYNDVLSILIPLDTNQTMNYKEDLDYVITKASRPIKFHKSSDFIDECYLLVGWVRMYKGDFENALTTFKYVNSKFTDEDSRHAALNALLRMFIETDEEANMNLVLDIIKQQKAPYNKLNTKDYHLNLAHYFRNKNFYPEAIKHLRIAADLEEKKVYRTRYYFILGQLYEKIGDIDNSYRYYVKSRKISKTNELDFQSDISAHSMQPVDFGDPKQEKKIEKYFAKKLKDHNYWDYRDKIYYEKAQFEMRKPDYDKALHYFNESVQVSTTNQTQKGHSYWESGKIYYDEKQDYIKAAAYYDSAVQNFNESVYGFEDIKKRSENLQELAKYTKMVEENERLIKLYEMSEEERNEFLEKEMEEEKEELILRQQYALENEKKRQKPETSSSGSFSNKESTEFYFYNTNAISQGKSQFLRTWGSRPLEDNWRRSNKMEFSSNDNLANQNDDPRKNNSKGKNKSNEDGEGGSEDLFAGLKSVEERKAEIPGNEGELQNTKNKLGDGVFGLGKVYLYRMKMNDHALENFYRMIKQFKDHEMAHEAAYLIYVICKTDDSCDEELAKSFLINYYPDCLYAKILKNPNYIKETNERELYIENLYADAYKMYINGQYNESDIKLTELFTQFPDSDFEIKGRFLRVLLIGRTTKYYKIFKKALEDYLEKYPDSEFEETARGMLDEIDEARLKNGYIPGRYHDYQITIEE